MSSSHVIRIVEPPVGHSSSEESLDGFESNTVLAGQSQYSEYLRSWMSKIRYYVGESMTEGRMRNE